MTLDIFKTIYQADLRKHGWDPESESSLIELVDKGEDLTRVYYATILLREVGSIACIPALKKAMTYSKADVKITSLWTIAEIAGKDESKFYLQALIGTNYREKMTAVECITRHCGEEADDAVADRIRKLLPAKRPRIAWNGDRTELTIAVSFITQYSNREKVQKALSHVASQWDTLDAKERTQLRSLEVFNALLQ
jgi:hypothetical protein